MNSKLAITIGLVGLASLLGCSHTWKGMKETGGGFSELGKGIVKDVKDLPESIPEVDRKMKEDWW